MRRFLMSMLLAALCVIPTWGVNPGEIDWIGSINGVSTMTNTVNAGVVSRTYQVGNPESVYNALRSGLSRRGWQIVSQPQVSTGGAYVGTLVATRNGQTLKISTQAVVGVGGTMQVVLSDGGTTGDDGDDDPGPVAQGNGGVVINDAHVNRTLNMNGNLVVNGSHCNLTLRGTTSNLSLNASHCYINIVGRIGAISINGSHNRVIWSQQGNGGRTPSINNAGGHNSIVSQ